MGGGRRRPRLLLVEPRLLACLARWVSGRYEGTSPDAFSYDRGIRPLLGAVLVLVACEGAVVDALLAVLLPGTPWVWVALGLHLYALVWMVGFLASMVTRPHLLRPAALVVRDGIFAELVIPYAALAGARVARRPNFGRSGFKVDPHTGDALLAVGDANVAMDLVRTRPVPPPRAGPPLAMRTLRITVDEPAAFVAGLLRQLERLADLRPETSIHEPNKPASPTTCGAGATQPLVRRLGARAPGDRR